MEALNPNAGELVAPIPEDAPPVLTHRKDNKPSDMWTYTDEAGRALFHICRFDLVGGGKKILPQTLWRMSDGTLRWRWKGYASPRPLYQRHDLGARQEAPVLIVEGEKAADAAARIFGDHVCTTSPGGCKATATADWSPLAGRAVTIWPDNDDPGRDYASDVVRLALEAGAAHVKLVSVPGEWPKGWDLADELPVAVTLETLRAMLANPLRVAADGHNDDDSVTCGPSIGAREIEYERLATLSPCEYDRQRKRSAKGLGIRSATLDDEVKRRRPPPTDSGQGANIKFDEPTPCGSPVDGAAWLDSVASIFARYAALPAHAATALALWSLHAWVFEASFATPRLAITSPQPRCGKSTVLRLIGGFVPRPLPTANATASVLFRTVEMHRPSLLIDEADTFLSENDELRGLLNSGFERDGVFLRNVGDDHEPRGFSTHCAVAIALIGKLPPTLEDRSIKVPMRRAVRGEVKERFRPDRPPPEAAILRVQAARWRDDNLETLRVNDPDLPEALHDRARDCWRPLVGIADLVGGDWPKKAREAALALSGDGDAESLGVDLLKDIKAAFEVAGVERMSSAELVAKLIEDADRPWATVEKNDRPLTQNRLARRLKPFDVTTKGVRFPGGSTPKGYAFADFSDAFARYLGFESATPPQLNRNNGLDQIQSATRPQPVAAQNARKAAEMLGCGGVAVQNTGSATIAKIFEVEI